MNAVAVDVSSFLGRTELVGALMGSADAPKFAHALVQPEQKFVWFDWQRIELATASYLRFAYLPAFSNEKRRVIVTSGMKTPIRDDLQLVLEHQNVAIFEATRVARSKNYQLAIVGPLEDVYKKTLELVMRHPQTSARELMLKADSSVGQTAWHNRLTRLYEMGLLIRDKAGKELLFQVPRIEA